MLDYSGGNAYKCTQNRGNQVQILPLEPFHKSLLVSDLLHPIGGRFPGDWRQNCRRIVWDEGLEGASCLDTGYFQM